MEGGVTFWCCTADSKIIGSFKNNDDFKRNVENYQKFLNKMLP